MTITVDQRLTSAAQRRDAALEHLGLRMMDSPLPQLRGRTFERFRQTLEGISQRSVDHEVIVKEVFEQRRKMVLSHRDKNDVAQAQLDALRLKIVTIERAIRDARPSTNSISMVGRDGA